MLPIHACFFSRARAAFSIRRLARKVRAHRDPGPSLHACLCVYDERQSSSSMHEEKFGLESAFQNLINLVWRQVHHRRATPFFLQPWRFPFMHIIPFIQRVYIYIYTLSVPQEIIVLYF